MSEISKKTFTCINCPMGCQIVASIEDGKVTKVENNGCANGKKYVVKEIENPSRLVTSTVKVTGGTMPLIPVRTREEIPKDKIFECIKKINGITVEAPIEIGQVLISDVFGTDVIASNNVEKM